MLSRGAVAFEEYIPCHVHLHVHTHAHSRLCLQGGSAEKVSTTSEHPTLGAVGKLNNEAAKQDSMTCYCLIYHIYQILPYLHILNIVDLKMRRTFTSCACHT